MSCGNCLNRREFLARSTLAVAGAAALAAGCGGTDAGLTDNHTPVAIGGSTAVTLVVSTVPALATVGQLVRVGPNTDFLAVKRTSASPAAFLALSVVCTHQGCITNIEGNAFVCPCHDAHYDSNGSVTQQPQGTGGTATQLQKYNTSYDAVSDTLTIG